MIDEKLDELLSEMQEKCLQCSGGDCMNCEQKNIYRENTISQIKALIIESLGIKKDFDHTNSDFVSNNYDALYGYNQHIAEMKEKFK